MAEPARISWAPLSGWEGIAAAGSFGAAGTAGVSITLVEGLGLLSLIAGPGDGPGQKLKHLTGLDLPPARRVAETENHAALWSGPGRWLLRTRRQADLPALIEALAPLAAVSDQSAARVVLRLTGPMVRAALAKGVMIDLHGAAFPVHATAETAIAHIGAQIRRCPDGPEGAVFELFVPRSMARSFWGWLSASAAEFGCRVSAGPG